MYHSVYWTSGHFSVRPPWLDCGYKYTHDLVSYTVSVDDHNDGSGCDYVILPSHIVCCYRPPLLLHTTLFSISQRSNPWSHSQ